MRKIPREEDLLKDRGQFFSEDFTIVEAPQRASNKTVMYLSFAVVGFFIYKFMLKK